MAVIKITRFHEKPVFSRPSYLVLSVSLRHCRGRTGFMIANSSRAAQIIKLEREGRHNGKKKKDNRSFSILQVSVITLTAHSHHWRRHRGGLVMADVILGNISFAPAFTGFHPIFSFSIETGICVTASTMKTPL